MTAQLVVTERNPQSFIGLSTDAKATDSNTKVGAAFYETDTGNTYKWNGAAWNLTPTTRPYALRNAGVLHRNAAASTDKLAAVGTLTTTDAGAGGALANVAYNVAVAAGNRWGTTATTTGGPITPTAVHRVKIAFAAVTGADYYDIFLSTDAQPKWVGRITEAQRASGILLDSVGTTSAGGAVNSVYVGAVGTGLANNVAPFSVNNAYTPASVTPVNCAGYSRARVLVKTAVTDLRSLPTLILTPFFANQVSAADWHMGTPKTLSLLTAVNQSLEQDYEIDVDGSTGLVVLVDTISGQGTAASVWVELA